MRTTQQTGVPPMIDDNADGLIAHYPLNGNAKDVANGKRHGTLIGTTPVADRHGNEGNALHFNGIDDMVTLAAPPPLNKTGTTIALWARFEPDGKNSSWQDIYDGPGFSQPLVMQDDGSGIRVLAMSLWKGKFRSNGQGYGHSLVSDAVAKPDTWYHIALTRDGKNHRLYVDGVKVSDHKDLFSVCHCHPMIIGGRVESRGTKNSFFGDLDDLRIYDRVLTEEELKNLAK
jgi:hypothetical protein